MNFKLADIITDANKDIASSLYIDPLGMLVIWSSYGEAIFEKRVNSISNDVRNFTVNLMHHGVVQSLISDSSFIIPEYLKNFVGDKTSSRFAQTCLLHLESAGQKRVPSSFIQNFPTAIPGVAEQEKIVSKVKELFSQIDVVVASTVNQIEKLKEYKTTLINSAVTGKIKITPDMLQA